MTDAIVVLGRLDPNDFLSGGMTLDLEASNKIIAVLAAKLGLADCEAAEGVLTILHANMANVIRSRTLQKGIDPRNFARVAMGGEGPLHGAGGAEQVSAGIVNLRVSRYELREGMVATEAARAEPAAPLRRTPPFRR